MNLSYQWLRDFVDFDLSPEELRDLLTSRAATVEGLEPMRGDLAPIVVARVVEAEPHPNSDHLWVTKVDAGGGELLDVVCGAPVVKAGSLYPFAPVGTAMPGGLKIEKRKIRGATSQGMLCSARELGLGEDGGGILELAVDAAPGTPLLDAMPLGDTRLAIDVLPNRPDLLSHLGVAREIAGALGRPLDPLAGRGPEISDEADDALRRAAADGPDAVSALVRQWGGRGERELGGAATDDAPVAVAAPAGATEGECDGVRVAIADVAGCPRYLGALVRGLEVGPSPEWLRARLEAVGARSINNVVDVTNYMLHGFGQPMHAFDLARLAGPEVMVRRARRGERLVTLDGVERPLDEAVLVIADAERPQAIAGVMGGRESEVTAGTTDIFLEVAAFDARTVRRTRRTLGISTDASYRFERATDVESADVWLMHALHLIVEVSGGRVRGAPVDLYPAPPPSRSVALRVERVARLLGEHLSAPHIGALLRSAAFDAELVPGTEMLTGSEELRVAVPSWRPDVTSEVDLIEEVARLHGYDALPNDLRAFRLGGAPDAPAHLVARRVREALAGAGLLEARPMPFVRGDDGRHVRVANPLAENEAHLRREVLESLTRRAEYNLAHMQGNVRMFEIGAAFLPSPEALPREETHVAALVMGARRPPHFTEPSPPAFDEWDAKGLAELAASAAFEGRAIRLLPATGGGEELWRVVAGDDEVGVVRRVRLDAPVWASPAFGFELRLGTVDSAEVAPPGHSAASGPGARASTETASREHRPRYEGLPTTPAVERDLALLVPDAITAERVEQVLRASGGELLESISLFDEFRGAGIPAGVRSLAWRLTFRHPERTLRDKEIEGRREKILRTLETELGVRQRTS